MSKEKILSKRTDRDAITNSNGDFKEPEPLKRLKVAADLGSKVTLKTPFPQDADEKFDESDREHESEEEEDKSSDKESEEEDDDNDEDEDQLELMREYAKIKKEREEEQRKRE